jgi:hypothetical protein
MRRKRIVENLFTILSKNFPIPKLENAENLREWYEEEE